MPPRTGFSVQWVPEPSLIGQAFFASAEQASQLEPAMLEVVNVAADEISLNFQEEGRPEPWQPLAAGTIEQRARYGFGAGPILDRTGELRGGVEDPSSWDVQSQGTQMWIARLEDDTGHGSPHLTGREPTMPIRDWSYLSDEALDNMANIVLEHITAALS